MSKCCYCGKEVGDKERYKTFHEGCFDIYEEWENKKYDVICPYCEYEMEDCEKPYKEGYNEITCPSCGKIFEVEAELESTWNWISRKREKDFKAIEKELKIDDIRFFNECINFMESDCDVGIYAIHRNTCKNAIEALEKQIVKTNADGIRNMTDEELAEFLNKVVCREINITGECKNNKCIKRYCTECTCEWLQKEVEE